MIIGFGLVSTFRENTSVGKWVGYQMVGAVGVGLIVRDFSLVAKRN
jgi:hypothetical protein